MCKAIRAETMWILFITREIETEIDQLEMADEITYVFQYVAFVKMLLLKFLSSLSFYSVM